MNLSHYSWEAALEPQPAEQREPSPMLKPSGLWVSVDGPDDWAAWCTAEQFRDVGAQYRHAVTLAASADVLTVTTPRALDRFARTYGLPSAWGGHRLGVDTIDWPRVAEHHQGVIVAPYQGSIRQGHPWYWGWDCASGCIWDPAAIDAVALVTSPDDAVEARA